MSNTTFMRQKYSLNLLIRNYLNEIKALQAVIKTPSDESKLQTYYQAANAFRDISTIDIVKFALSFGRNTPGKSGQMKSALPIILGNRVTQPSYIDLIYAKLLLDYAKAFKIYRKNLKEWSLRFILSSRFSPMHRFFEHEIDALIDDTQQKIVYYSKQA